MKQQIRILLAITCMGALLLTAACAKKQVKSDPGAGTRDSQVSAGEGTDSGKLEQAQINTTGFQEIDADATELKNVFTDITFDYDDFSLKPSAKETLKTIAEWLLKNTGKQILVEGHCDERGTNEYNLALGERRANSAKKYLVQLGVSPKRIATISYGEERPVAPGNNEDAWAKNRRDHFLLR